MEEHLIWQLLSVMYNSSCDCRNKFKFSVNLHYLFHLEDCPYRMKIEFTELKEIFDGRSIDESLSKN